VEKVPQKIQRGGSQGGSDWRQREVHPGVAVLAGVVILVFILFLVNQFITPIFPRRQVSQEEAWQQKQQELAATNASRRMGVACAGHAACIRSARRTDSSARTGAIMWGVGVTQLKDRLKLSNVRRNQLSFYVERRGSFSVLR
jgi:hypothetical protein